jgi:hypothetical protein
VDVDRPTQYADADPTEPWKYSNNSDSTSFSRSSTSINSTSRTYDSKANFLTPLGRGREKAHEKADTHEKAHAAKEGHEEEEDEDRRKCLF